MDLLGGLDMNSAPQNNNQEKPENAQDFFNNIAQQDVLGQQQQNQNAQ